MGKGCIASLIITLLCVGGLIFAGEFYTAERVWDEGVRLGDTIPEHPPLNVALGKCIAAHDPASLRSFRLTGAYRISGWFLNEDRWSDVAQCMRLKGWILMPVHIYTL